MVGWKDKILAQRRREAKAQAKDAQKNKHYCGDCGNGTWYFTFINKSLDGLPICCKCPFHTESMIRSEQACINWKPKKEGELILTPDRQENVDKESLVWITK